MTAVQGTSAAIETKFLSKLPAQSVASALALHCVRKSALLVLHSRYQQKYPIARPHRQWVAYRCASKKSAVALHRALKLAQLCVGVGFWLFHLVGEIRLFEYSSAWTELLRYRKNGLELRNGYALARCFVW